LLDEFRIERWAIDFGKRSLPEAAHYSEAFKHVQANVLPAVQASLEEARRSGSDMASARQEHLNRWWQFWNRRDEMSEVLGRQRRYIACSRVTRRPVMVFLSSSIYPSDLVQVFAFEDDYSFGILQSALHFEWFKTSSRLKVESDARYSVRAVFETFPWPQKPTSSQVIAVAQAARHIRALRAELVRSGGGLRAVYRLLELPGHHPLKDAHAALDAAVRKAYGFGEHDAGLEALLELNHAIAESTRLREAVQRPGIPECFLTPTELVSIDCLEP
jgi:hypothetical protein